jgi:hypothetical protein
VIGIETRYGMALGSGLSDWSDVYACDSDVRHATVRVFTRSPCSGSGGTAETAVKGRERDVTSGGDRSARVR